ncbi:hypothetical protein [Rubrobacter aplysinae]|uniref:hypothetical protein n=1 Tax=Rubrobacter aplysinae TaxID=909625 RepID=UPI00069E88C7|nr:hypothetical protein [Rubrobacter aplysinae]
MRSGLLRWLGEAGFTIEDGRVGLMDLLTRAGLPVPEGFILTREGHRAFLGACGPAHTLHGPTPPGGLGVADRHDGARTRTAHPTAGEPGPTVETLTRLIREAVLDMEAVTVSVCTEDFRRRGLGSLSEVLREIRRAWALEEPCPRGASDRPDRERITWPVLVQREIPTEYGGWSITEDAEDARSVSGVSGPFARSVRLDGVIFHGPGGAAGHLPEDPGSAAAVARFTREAAAAAGGPVWLEWGRAYGRWHVLSVSRGVGEGEER